MAMNRIAARPAPKVARLPPVLCDPLVDLQQAARGYAVLARFGPRSLLFLAAVRNDRSFSNLALWIDAVKGRGMWSLHSAPRGCP